VEKLIRADEDPEIWRSKQIVKNKNYSIDQLLYIIISHAR
jgi:hypothetical protein